MRDTSTDTRAAPAGDAPHPEPTEEQLRTVAIKRVKAKRDFRNHVFIYLVVNLGLWGIWLVSGIVDEWTFPWPAFVTVFWGMFVLGQWYDVYRRKALREDLVQREIEQLRAATKDHPLDTYDVDDDV